MLQFVLGLESCPGCGCSKGLMFARMHLFRSFRAALGHGRNFRSNTDSLDTLRPRPANHGMGMGARRPVVTAAAAGAGNLVQLLTKTAWGARLGFGMLTGTAAGAAAWHWKEDNEEAGPFETTGIAWVQQLAEQPGMKEMLVPGQMLRKHPVGQLISTDDHLVSKLIAGTGTGVNTAPAARS